VGYKDYYKILGVKKSASKQEIKKAYRGLAMKYHPDKTKGDKASEERFKEVSEAYAVLSDDKKRGQYDSFGTEGFHQRFSQEDIFRGADMGDIFGDIFKGSGVSTDTILSQLFGGGFGRRGTGSSRRSGFSGSPFSGFTGETASRQGQDLSMDLKISLREAYSGGEKGIAYRADRLVEVKVKIPRGIDTGQRLRLKGKGLHGGDLFLMIQVDEDPVFRRDGDDLTVDREIKVTDALLGAGIEVPSMDGARRIKVPPLTQSHTRIRIKNQGMPRFKGNGRGDLFVRVVVRFPDLLTATQKNLIRKLQEEGM